MRTGQLVVRYHSSWRRRAALVGAVCGGLLLLYVMYEWGRFEGGYSKFAEVQRRRELVSADRRTRSGENEKLRAQAAERTWPATSSDKSYADVEKNLADLQAQVLKAREQLTFYRGIVSPEDGIGGLRIQSLQVLPGPAEHHYRLRLVLAQSMRQDAVVSGVRERPY